MKSFILAAITAVSLGMGAANAATPSGQAKQVQIPKNQTHRPNYYNWLEGGGG
ncbi:MAG: hypothetical protein QOF70_466 [Acetobacteraceae bacterium]|jgi:hypothetical protein|nr:hypothetical protein [Acetobacteraceae bacterium]